MRDAAPLLALLADVSAAEPPENLSRPLQALWWLNKGKLANGPEWQRAHTLCQEDEGDADHDIVHALVHWVEGDMSNAAYWYRRAAQTRAGSLPEEWLRIARLLAPTA